MPLAHYLVIRKTQQLKIPIILSTNLSQDLEELYNQQFVYND